MPRSTRQAIIRRDWNDGALQSNAGTHRLQDFGAAYVAELWVGRSIVVPDVGRDPRIATSAAANALAGRGITAFVNVPHVHGDRLTGLLAVKSADHINRAMECARAEQSLRASGARQWGLEPIWA